MTVIVSVSEDESQVVGEMGPLDSGEIGMLAEMITDAAKLDTFNPGWGQKGAALAAAVEDDKPQFAVLRVEEGWSNSRRLWGAPILESIAEQTNALEPVGHLGHIEDDKASTAFPEPQTTWFGAFTRKEASKQKGRLGEQVTTAYFAGYLLPGAKVRTLIPTRAVRGISWWGPGEVTPVPGKGVEVKHFTLKALDWARKLAEGMPTSSIVAVTSEMEGGDVADKSLAQVTPDELRKENPNLAALLVRDAVEEKDTTIGEMQEKIEAGEDDKQLLVKLCEVVGLEPDKAQELVTKVTALKERVGDKAKATVTAGITKLLEEKVPDEEKRAIVSRLLPVGEMETAVADAKDQDEADKIISEMVDAAFDKDEILQSYIGEQTAPNPGTKRRQEFKSQGGNSNLDQALESQGMTRERVSG